MKKRGFFRSKYKWHIAGSVVKTSLWTQACISPWHGKCVTRAQKQANDDSCKQEQKGQEQSGLLCFEKPFGENARDLKRAPFMRVLPNDPETSREALPPPGSTTAQYLYSQTEPSITLHSWGVTQVTKPSHARCAWLQTLCSFFSPNCSQKTEPKARTFAHSTHFQQ